MVIELPPGWEGEVPDGYHAGQSSTFRVLGGIRSLPVGGDGPAAVERLQTVTVRPLDPAVAWQAPTWRDLSPEPQDTTPDRWEENLGYGKALHEVVDSEPPFDGYRGAYGELAALGIAKGRPFAPDARMKAILERAARTASAQLRVQSLAGRRPDRLVWPGRRWEWAALRFENGDFDRPDSVDTEARDKWYYQAIGSSPAMFRRDAKAGSLYWLGLRDADAATTAEPRSRCDSGRLRRPAARTDGCRHSRALAGSRTSASTVPGRAPSTAAGNRAIFSSAGEGDAGTVRDDGFDLGLDSRPAAG